MLLSFKLPSTIRYKVNSWVTRWGILSHEIQNKKKTLDGRQSFTPDVRFFFLILISNIGKNHLYNQTSTKLPYLLVSNDQHSFLKIFIYYLMICNHHVPSSGRTVLSRTINPVTSVIVTFQWYSSYCFLDLISISTDWI